jgi:phosphatidylserine/phosphatidylglycerophosphate/cardiolipin synthase-like enzyme
MPLRHDANEQPYQSSTIPHDVRQRRRERLHGLLAQADVDDRYRLMSPSVSEFVTGCINVHRKLMLINDELLLVGSANLNSRSMVLGTECNMAIRAFRARWP